ncbi:MAG TPA: hypothetical protein PKG52_05485 [bacterium]|nr:hypothetical protein [bacterium]HPS29722.1 hypothetical protein [bacterium]
MRKLSLILLVSVFLAVSCDNVRSSVKQDNENTDPDSDSSVIEDEDSAKTDDDIEYSDETDGQITTDDFTDEAADQDEEVITPDEDIPVLPLEFESGFIEIGTNSYTLDGNDLTSGAARMWYNFQPADVDPADKPLFVFFNGGPGAATMLLFTYNTSKMTGDQAYADIDVVDNAFNWNRMGNLLYIDARMTGFSYGITDDPSSASERNNYFDPANFNVFVDAADFIRVIFGFLDRHPEILANKVVLVGESYGGTRATAMLNILLNVRDYAAGNRNFYDKNLFATIDNHFRKVYPEMSADPHKEVIKQQFYASVMIQPLIAGEKQFQVAGELLEIEGSPIYTVESETGVNYSPCSQYNPGCEPHNNALQYLQKANRDMYSYRRPYNWLFDYTDPGAQKMVELALFEKLIRNDPREIDWLYASNRAKAFRYSSGYLKNQISDLSRIPATIRTEIEYNQSNIRPMLVGNLDQTFGTLPSYDDYFIDLHTDVTNVFYYASTTPYSDINGEMFLENIRDVKSFITQAEEDIIIYAPALPLSLKEFEGVSGVTVEDNDFTVKFSDNTEATVHFPFYPVSSHSVSVNQPEQFFNDVNEWLFPK